MRLPNMLDAAQRKAKANYIYEHRINQKIFGGKKYYIRTYGCQMNVHDTEEIKGLLESLGFNESENINISDLIILNTCAIRENAHDKVFGFLGRLKHLKKNNPNLIIGLCGCMAQEESVVTYIKEKHSYIDIVFGTHNICELPKMLEEYTGKQKINVDSKEGNVIEFDNLYKRDSNITAWVNIMYGCDKFCTYCIVPYTRGKQRSRKLKDILKEVIELKNAGYKEITLLGQNVNAYGKDLEEKIEFSTLLEKVSKIGIERIRFVTSHPWDFTDEMIDVISKYDNIMPYIHLPVQSGSNKILKLMNRKYTNEEYLTLFYKIKNKIKNVSITTDIIVGFPGELEEDFEETLNLVKKCQFDGAFTFIFSARENTPASKMKDSLSLEEKNNRLQKLNKLINNYSKESNLKTLGTIQKVLVTSISERDNNKVAGYTENMKLVNIDAPASSIGKIIDVEIIDAKSFSLDGIMKI
ncbi:MAG: tRNA (N6-isopentenyl adenosine(37)-C2)-methylthiotransferase MiaB [Bacilli bacterium]|nr:tRNA (N6-isopentenyl adenosine(37)-C2)-methylthiotransferase MiaB [Bacilli bacterium]MDD4406774.1 tRNA (N6-isopentenyl adenosine(37)-C2)-methylthiotransferase MiaB [Bacilli bacterium]